MEVTGEAFGNHRPVCLAYISGEVTVNCNRSASVQPGASSSRMGWIVVLGSVATLFGALLMNCIDVQPTLGRHRMLDESNRRPEETSPHSVADLKPLAQRGLTLGSESDSTIVDAPPRLVVEETMFDFGRMDPFSMGQHTFVVRNAGPGPLRLLDHRSTCSCTIGEFSRRPIAAGESAEIIVRWKTQANDSRFEQSAIIETNDPQHPQLCFTVNGSILVHAGANPPEFSFPSVRPDSGDSATSIISSQVWSDFSLRNIRSSLEGLTWSVDATTEPERVELRSLSAQRLIIELPDSLPQGHFTHWLRFEVAPEDRAAAPLEYELPIRGKVLRRLAVYGPGIDAFGNVHLGAVDAGRGLKRRLMLKVYDRDVQLHVNQITSDPSLLKVTVTPYGESGTPNAQARVDADVDADVDANAESLPTAHGLYLLDIEIPPGSPTCAHQDQSAGIVRIQFDHPRISDLQLRVHFAVAARLADAT
jgi:hypothetical protein